jgi:hypothetical protein
LRNEARRAANIVEAAGAGEASAVLTPILAALRREPSAVIHTDTRRRVEELARRVRIGVYSFMSGGAYVARASTLTQRGLILGYAALSRKQIEQGIARLSDAIDDAIDDPSADVNALFVCTGFRAETSRVNAIAS